MGNLDVGMDFLEIFPDFYMRHLLDALLIRPRVFAGKRQASRNFPKKVFPKGIF